MANPFDQFDAQKNPFDQFDAGDVSLGLKGAPILTAADLAQDVIDRNEEAERIRNTAYVATPFGTFEAPRALAEPILTQTPRIALPIGTAMALSSGVGTLPALAAIGGAGVLGSVAGQEAEKSLGMREQISAPEALLEGGISAIPGLNLTRIASPLARVGLRGIEGAAIGAGQDVAMRAVRGEEQDLGGTLRSAGIGGAISLPLGLGEFARMTPREAAVIERIKDKPLEMQKQIVEQEIRLGKGIDSPETQRNGLELKQQINLALEKQKAAEAADKVAQAEIKQGQKALAESQQLQAEAMQPPEIPKSTQILMDEAKPPVLANVAAEAASQSGGSPYALQTKLNELTAAPAPAVVPELANPAVAALAEPGAQKPSMSPSEGNFKPEEKVISNDGEYVRFTTQSGKGLLNRDAYDMSKLTDSQEMELSELLNYGLQQPRNVPAGSIFYFTKDGEKQNKRLIALLKKAAKEPIVRTVKKIQGNPIWKTSDGQVAFSAQKTLPEGTEFLYEQGGVKYYQMPDAEAARGSRTVDAATLKAEGFDTKGLPKGKEERIFYRGTNPENEQRIAEPFTAAKGKTFAARTPEGASQYGPSIEEIKAKPNAKILSDDTPEFWKVIGRKRPPNGYIGSSGKAGESLVSVVNAAIRKAEAAGYDAISIGDADIGTVILNEKAFTRNKLGEPTNAIREQETASRLLRSETPQPELDVGLQRVVEQNRPEAPAGNVSRVQAPEESQVAPSAELRLNNAGIGLKPISSLTRAEKRAELDAAGITTYNGKPLDDANPAEISAAVGKLRRGQLTAEGDLTQRGAISPALLTPAATTAAGAAYGATQGDSPEERLRNAILYGSIGLGGGTIAQGLAQRAFQKPVRTYTSPVLKDVAKMLTPKEETTSLFEKIASAGSNFRYKFNTRFAPIGRAQQELYKETGREFTPDRYYDLERGFERLAGAPVQAEGEVELLQNIVDKLPKKDVPHLDTYLTLSRIEDRLVKTGEENARLMDAVGIAQAEADAAVAANRANPTPANSLRAVDARKAVEKAKEQLTKEFDRKRVGDWSINQARQGLADLEAEIGAAPFAAIRQAGQEYQDVMKRALQIQVDSGRMSQDLMDRVLESNDFYAPFKVLKYYEDEEGFVRGGGTRKIPSSEHLAKRITGIDDTDVRIGSPTNVAAEQIYKGYILAQKNRKLRELATLSYLDPDGKWIKLVEPDAETRKGFEKVTYFVNGEKRAMEVDRQIADSLNGLDVKEADSVLKWLGKGASIFKLGATGLSVPFNISNAAIFDPLRLATISRYGFRGPQDFLYTLYEWPRAAISSARGNILNAPDALYEQWIKSGAANSTLARVMTPEAFASRLPKDVKTGEVLVENNFGLGPPIKAASLISNTLEETTKLLGLQRAIRLTKLDKLPPAERARKWDEIVTELRNYAGSPDFSRAGVSMRPLNILLPFLNPRWQGFTADFARLNPFTHGNTKDAVAAWSRLGALVGVPATALAVYNLSTPENERDYFNIPQQDRDKYYHIPLYRDSDGEYSLIDRGNGGYYFKNKDGAEIRGYYRIPKREFPGLMANTIEDFVGYTKVNSPESFGQLAVNFAGNAAQTGVPIGIEGDNVQERILSAASGANPVLRLPLEVALNRSLYTGRNIVPESRAKASPKLQYTEQTPEAYKAVAGALPEQAPEILRSPAMLQHLTEGMTGNATRQFIAPKLSEGNPAGETSPLLGRFYRSERIESSDLVNAAEAAERARTDQRIIAQEQAGKLADAVLKLPTAAERQQAVQRAVQSGRFSPATFDYLKEELKDAQRGLTYEDRIVKRSFSVAGNFRAQYYLDKIAKMDAEQRREYLLDQRKKGLLTKEVVNQLGALMRQPQGRN